VRGTTMPPSAPSAGTNTVCRSPRSPEVTSRLISKPSTRKKTDIAPSLIKWSRSIPVLWSPKLIATVVCQNAS
jgi:hypothetical protein